MRITHSWVQPTHDSAVNMGSTTKLFRSFSYLLHYLTFVNRILPLQVPIRPSFFTESPSPRVLTLVLTGCTEMMTDWSMNTDSCVATLTMAETVTSSASQDMITLVTTRVDPAERRYVWRVGRRTIRTLRETITVWNVSTTFYFEGVRRWNRRRGLCLQTIISIVNLKN